MPRELSEEAKAEWRRIVPVLEEAGLLNTIDRALLIRYCCAWADWLELQGLIQQSGKLLKGARGHLVRNPLWFRCRTRARPCRNSASSSGSLRLPGFGPA
ncbi:MAG: phage terminase small subunit P27 family [Chloroflexota bacterium]